jgi:hypothetical protein
MKVHVFRFHTENNENVIAVSFPLDSKEIYVHFILEIHHEFRFL